MSATQSNIGVGGTGTFSTSSAQTVIETESIPENSAGKIESLVSARRVSDGAVKVFKIEAGFKRDSGDIEVFGISVNALGTTLDLVALATANVTIDSDADLLRVRATGLSAQAIDWSANLTGVTVNHE